MADPITSRDVLAFWFSGEPLGDAQMGRWWKKDEAVDSDIRARFSRLVDDVHDRLSDEWSNTAEGRLAAIICLDQFPRNMYRNDPKSFHYDQRALELSREGLWLKQYKALKPLHSTLKFFFDRKVMYLNLALVSLLSLWLHGFAKPSSWQQEAS